MSTEAQSVLESFDRLSSRERREVLDEILRRARDLEWPSLDDETVDRIANETFLEYDLREAADGDR